MKAYAVLNNKKEITWTEEDYFEDLLKVMCIYATKEDAEKARASLLVDGVGDDPGPVASVEIAIREMFE